MESTMTLPIQPKGKMKTGTIVGIGAGTILLIGGIVAVIYHYNGSSRKGNPTKSNSGNSKSDLDSAVQAEQGRGFDGGCFNERAVKMLVYPYA